MDQGNSKLPASLEVESAGPESDDCEQAQVAMTTLELQALESAASASTGAAQQLRIPGVPRGRPSIVTTRFAQAISVTGPNLGFDFIPGTRIFDRASHPSPNYSESIDTGAQFLILLFEFSRVYHWCLGRSPLGRCPSLPLKAQDATLANVKSPRVPIILDASTGWSRGILRGFAVVAHERGWTLLHYHPTANLVVASILVSTHP